MSRRVFSIHRSLALLFAGAALSCLSADDLPMIVPSEPAQVTVSPPSVTLSSLGDTAVFHARILDQRGESYPGTVAWSTSDEAVFSVSSGGVVTAAANGAGTLTASFEGLSGTAAVTVRQAADTLAIASGSGQEGLPGRPLAELVVIQVLDARGSAIEGAPVEFAPSEGHGSVDPASGASDADGRVATAWTLGDSSGVQRLSVTAHLASDPATPIALTEVRAVVGDVPPPSDTAVYRFTFNATWSATTHPTDFPPGPHFSPLIGAVHSDSVVFWAFGDTASRGIEQMAETGGTGLLSGEIRAHIPGAARSLIQGRGIGSPAATSISGIHVTLDHPLVTLVTMLAPSPDWFVGTSGLSLLDEFGQWVDSSSVVLYAIDAGTDDGPSYRSPNADTSPRQRVHSLKGVSPFSDEPIGTFTFVRTDRAGS